MQIGLKMKIKVLDNGFVQYVDHMGSDLTVVNSARVSFDNQSEWDDMGEGILSEKDEKLIRYLSKHNHWTPFAHPQITLRIKAPISIRTQCFKHKQGFVENEISRRYVDFKPDFYYPRWRERPDKNKKQGSSGWLEGPGSAGVRAGTSWFRYETYDYVIRQSLRVYENLISSNVAPEQARFVLPQSMYTEWYWTGSLAAYGRFFKLRSDSNAQWEIQEYSRAIGKIVKSLFPVSWEQLVSS